MADSRLAFDIIARGGSSAAAEFEKVARGADKAGDSMKKNAKISADTAKATSALTKAHNAESTALDKVQIAEAKLAEVRANGNAKTSQVLTAEKALAKARRDAAVAGNVAQKAAKDLGQALDNEGKKAGKSLGGSVLHWFTGAGKDFENAGASAGRSAGNGVIGAITGALKTPVLGPALVVALTGAVGTAAPAVGAVVAGGIVAGAGAGLAGIGLKFAAESEVVKSIWSKTAEDLGAQMKTISKPLESTLSALAVVARRTFASFKPQLAAAFKSMAPYLTAFGDQLGLALGKLAPTIQPLANAFDKVLNVLGPALNTVFANLAKHLTDLANSVSKNPTALADMARAVGTLSDQLLGLVTDLNNADAAFKKLTGFSSVTATMAAVEGGVVGVRGVLEGLTFATQKVTQGVMKVGDAYDYMNSHRFGGWSQDATGAKQAATATSTFSSSLFKAANNLTLQTEAAQHSAHATHEANVAAALAAGAFDRQTAATNASNAALSRQSSLLLQLSGSQIAFQQALDDATAAVKANGKTLDLNTQKGRDNRTALNNVASAAIAQVAAMRSAGDGNVKAAAFAEQARKSFVKQATQMGMSKSAAQALATQLIAIPNVTRTAKLLAEKKDLDTKLADAKRQLADPNLTKERRAKLNADITALQKALAKAQAQIDGMHGKTVPITYTISGQNFTLNTKTPSRVGGLATGGPVSGPGTGTSDTAGVFALSNNEWVVKASSAQGYGPKAMKSINDGTATVIPGMATGGAVNIHGTGVFGSNAQMQKYLMQNFGGGPTGPAGAGVQRWRAVALQALALAGEPPTWIGSLLARMQRESGGNPRAINLWDSNAKAGTPSIGLMQTIGPTFNAYAGSLKGRGIYDPLANIYAAIRYTVARYGSGPAGWNKAGGYKQGTPWVPEDQMALLHKGEAVVPASVNKRSAGVGGDVASGMAQGMLGGGKAAVNAAGQVASDMITKAKTVLGISSPSKAFAQLGLYINQGFRLGLMGSSKQVQSTMSSLMSKVLNISFNAADTKKSIQKTITSLNAALAAARGRIKPITSHMTSKQRDTTERHNRQAEASIRSIQAKLASARIDLANVNAIANRLGTTVKRNAVIGMLNRENVAMQKLANARATVANQLKAAQTKLANAIQVRDDFKKQITDAALSFNSITNISTETGVTLSATDILQHMQQTLAQTRAFTSSLARLKAMGLSSDLYKQIAEAGVDQGGQTAAALLAGGSGAVKTANSLQSQIASASAGLGNTAATNLYQAGVNAAQGLVNGLLAKTKALDAASKKLANAIVAQIKKTLGIHSPSRVTKWHGQMVTQGFVSGMVSELPTVKKAAERMAGLAAPSTPVRRSGGNSGAQTIRLEIVAGNSNAYTDFLVRELRKFVRVAGGGDVQMALGVK